MKKLLLAVIVAANTVFAMTSEELNEFKKNKLLGSGAVTFIKGKMIDKEFAQIKGYSSNRYGYSPVNIITNKKIVVFGKAFDAKTRNPIEIDFDYEQYKKDAAFTLGTGKKEMMIFTEAECPACKSFDPFLEKLKKDYTIYVYMFPLNGIHYAARDIAKATLAQKPEEAKKFYNRMLSLKDVSTVLPELENYSVDVYKNVLSGLNSRERRASGLSQRYTTFIEKAYGVKFKDKQEIEKFCKDKIAKFESNKELQGRSLKLDILLDRHKKVGSGYLGLTGTPSLFEFNGRSVNTQQLLSQYR